MAQLLDHIDYLSREIGARPAGTEEEQEAALYIAEQLQKEAGFHAEIEEFTSSSNLEGARSIPAAIIVLAVILAMIFNVLTIPAIILSLIATAIYTLEAFDRPLLSKPLSRGMSQNVVAKYQPFSDAPVEETRGRVRKIVLVAHYDSGKVKPGIVESVESSGLPWGNICIGGMIASIVLLLLRIFLAGGGAATMVLNILTVVALVIVALPIVKAVLYRIAPYNEGANNNASGAAALIEVATRISTDSVSEAEYAAANEQVVIHGEQAALESGLLPDGVKLVYDVEAGEEAPVYQQPEEPEPYDELEDASEEERLLAAKAAIAALTGHHVESRLYAPVSGDAGQDVYDGGAPEKEAVPANAAAPVRPYAPTSDIPQGQAGQRVANVQQEVAPVQAAVPGPAPATTLYTPPATETAGFQNAPSWFVNAQRNAKKSAGEVSQSQRSRYNSAIDEAERQMAERDRDRERRENARREEERRAREQAARVAMVQKPVQEAAATDVAATADKPEAVVEAKAVQAEQQVKVDDTQIKEQIEEQIEEQVEAAAQPQATVSEESQLAPEAIPAVDVAEELPAEPEVAADEEDRDGTVAFAPVKTEEVLAELKEQEDRQADPEPERMQLPAIEVESSAGELETSLPEDPARADMLRKLRADIPAVASTSEGQKEAAAPARDRAQVRAIPSPATPSASVLPAVQQMLPVDIDEPVDYDMNVADVADVKDASADESASASDAVEQTSEQASAPKKKRRRWLGGAFSRIHLHHVDTRSSDDAESDVPDEMVESDEDRILNEEIGQIMHFRNPAFDTEIWFVAIGSDTELHDGAKAFVEEHRSELRGSMIIEVESLGAGLLSVASEEGQFRKTKASSRAKRILRPATEKTGIVLDEVKLNGADSITTTVQKAGFQAMHLLGVEDGKPALKGSADDVVENIDDLILEDNIDFIMELLKQ